MDCEGKIKGLITNARMTINEKGVKQYSITSFHRYIGTTNNGDPITTSKDDRRNLVISSSNELIGNKDYFNKCYEYLNDVNVIKTCYEYFKSIDGMKDFNKIPMPETEYQNDMKDVSVSPIENWIKSFVLDNYYEISVELLGKTQYDLFKEWSNKCGIDYNVTLQAFGLRMKRLNITGIEKGKHTNKGETKIFKIIQLRNHFKMNDIVMDTSDNVE
jgi:phage/plasmid-associated DNA primase